MKINQTHIDGCFYTKPNLFVDDRGVFSEIYKNSIFDSCKQVNYSYSKRGSLRGMHKTPYAKFVTCVYGKIYDVCLDLRSESKTYLQHHAMVLDNITLNSMYIPSDCGHGFLALEDSIIIYLQTEVYNKDFDQTFCYKNYNINWPIIDNIIISYRDMQICDT